MGTFTLEAGIGLLALGLVVMAVIGLVGLIIINYQQKQEQDTGNKTDIQRQLERLRR